MSSSLILSFSFRNHLDEVNTYCLSFTSIPDFKNYLRWEPEKAMQLQYGQVDPERVANSRTTDVKIVIQDNGKPLEFRTARALADFLQQRPAMAKRLQFPLH